MARPRQGALELKKEGGAWNSRLGQANKARSTTAGLQNSRQFEQFAQSKTSPSVDLLRILCTEHDLVIARGKVRRDVPHK
jgi:hypothetical protein